MSIQSFFEYEDDSKQKYYYNVETQESTYDFPANGLIFNPDTRELIYKPPNYNPGVPETSNNQTYEQHDQGSTQSSQNTTLIN